MMARLESHQKSCDTQRSSTFLNLFYSLSSFFTAKKATEPLFYAWMIIIIISPCQISFISIYWLVSSATAAAIEIAITTNPAFSSISYATKTFINFSIPISKTSETSTPISSPTTFSHNTNYKFLAYIYVIIFTLVLIYIIYILVDSLAKSVGRARKQRVEILVATAVWSKVLAR